MKIFNLILLMILQSTVGFCQSDLDQNINFDKDVFNETFIMKNSYKALPNYIQKYLTKTYGKKFKISNKRFNSSDVNRKESTSRKLSYVAISERFYILSYQHGGKGNHHHSIIFEVNNNKIINVYNLITPTHHTIVELNSFLKNKLYSFQTADEI
jgi:hypothetical protein